MSSTLMEVVSSTFLFPCFIEQPNKHRRQAPTETEDEVGESRISSRPVRTMSRARERFIAEESAATGSEQRAY